MDLRSRIDLPAIFVALEAAMSTTDRKMFEVDEKLNDLAKMNGAGDAIRNRLRKRLCKKIPKMIKAKDNLPSV